MFHQSNPSPPSSKAQQTTLRIIACLMTLVLALLLVFSGTAKAATEGTVYKKVTDIDSTWPDGKKFVLMANISDNIVGQSANVANTVLGPHGEVNSSIVGTRTFTLSADGLTLTPNVSSDVNDYQLVLNKAAGVLDGTNQGYYLKNPSGGVLALTQTISSGYFNLGYTYDEVYMARRTDFTVPRPTFKAAGTQTTDDIWYWDPGMKKFYAIYEHAPITSAADLGSGILTASPQNVYYFSANGINTMLDYENIKPYVNTPTKLYLMAMHPSTLTSYDGRHDGFYFLPATMLHCQLYFSGNLGGVALSVQKAEYSGSANEKADVPYDFWRQPLSMYFLEMTYTGTTVNIKKDGAIDIYFMGTVKLQDTTDTTKTFSAQPSSGVCTFTDVVDGTYNILINDVDTGTDFAVHADNATADVNYYSVSSATMTKTPSTAPTKVGDTLTVTGVTRKDGDGTTTATVTLPSTSLAYQWEYSSTGLDGSWGYIPGATSPGYVIEQAYKYNYLRCQVSGTGMYAGVTYTNATPDTARSVLYTATLDSTTAQTGTPLSVYQYSVDGDATTLYFASPVSYGDLVYQWQRSDTGAAGSWTDISGAADYRYTPVSADVGKYLQCKVSASSAATNTKYTGTVYTPKVGPVTTSLKTATLDKSIAVASGDILKVSAVTDYTDAAVTVNDTNMSFQWQTSATGAADNWMNVSGATSLSYTVAAADVGKYLRCTVTGKGSYTGSVDATVNSTVRTGLKSATLNATSYKVGTAVSVATITLNDTADTVITNPGTTNFSYQWQNSSDNTNWTNIALNGSSISYTPVAADSGKYLRCYILGTNTYGGSAIASASSTVLMPLSGATLDKSANVATGDIIKVSTVTDYSNAAATVNDTNMAFQWQTSSDNTSWTDISGATNLNYTVAAADAGKYLRCSVTGKGSYTGTIYTAVNGTVLTGLNSATLNATSYKVGTALSVATITLNDTGNTTVNADATNFTYQWQNSSDNITWSNITLNGTSISYTPVAADSGKYLRCYILGTNTYSGSAVTVATSTVLMPLSGATLDKSTGVVAGNTLTVNAATDYTNAAVIVNTTNMTFQWQTSSDNTNWADISGATSASYTTTISNLSSYLRCAVTGAGGYTATVYTGATNALTVPIASATLNTNSPQISQPVSVSTITLGDAANTQPSVDTVNSPISGKPQRHSPVPGATSQAPQARAIRLLPPIERNISNALSRAQTLIPAALESTPLLR